MKTYCLFFLLTVVASAQVVSVGAIGGVPITDTTGRDDQSRPYIVGGSVEVDFGARFGIEADALYRRVGNTTFFGFANGSVLSIGANRQRGNSWEFPLIGKYYFRRTSAWQPFLGTGFAFRTVGVDGNTTLTTSDSTGVLQTVSGRGSFREPLEVGATVVGGLRFHYGRLAILPQIRYTRWGGANDLTRSNGTSFLLGVSF